MPGDTDTVVSGGTTSIVYVKPRDIDPSCHLRNAGGWSQWINDVRGALGGDYWNCTLATPIQKPNARTDLEHANFQAIALSLSSCNLPQQEEAVRSPVWNKKLWRRVRRWIPPPGILEPLVWEVFEKLGRCEVEATTFQQSGARGSEEICTSTLGPCGGPDGKADDGVRLYSCQRDTNSLEGGIHRNLHQRFPKSGVSPCHVNACTADYVLVHNLTVSPTPPSQFEEAATILTHSPLYSQVGTFNRTGKPFVGHYDLWLTVELHRLRRKTPAFFPRHSATVSDIVNPLLYTPSTETFGIVLVVQSPTAQMRFLIEPYQVERGTLRLEPVKWSPWNLLQNNTPAIQHMQSRLAIDRKLRHDWPAERRGTRIAVFSSKSSDIRDYRALEQVCQRTRHFLQTHQYMGTEMVVAGKCSSHNEHGMLAAKPLLGHKLPVLGRLTEVEVDFSDPSTSSIRAFVATASSAGSSADLGTSSALTRAGTTKGARHCRLCGQTTCRRKGTKLSDDGSVNECDGACLDCGKPFGLTDEMDPNDPQSRRFCRGLTRAEMNGRAWHQKKCHNFVAV
ncbi:BQ5605_C001g00365 [Microbotryum silenes-dioicae]|uniref:BQ5605_C001g00365 protein n=1 Tax=Microbotryum silenes-dioicae TaxID=796604 RepID=A0A2X0P5N7_9BASI|nr:BQ5605_C001g00365 [Microbotryum silenes-dioicae]